MVCRSFLTLIQNCAFLQCTCHTSMCAETLQSFKISFGAHMSTDELTHSYLVGESMTHRDFLLKPPYYHSTSPVTLHMLIAIVCVIVPAKCLK